MIWDAGLGVAPALLNRLSGQVVEDSLCGTEILHRSNFEHIAESRGCPGEFRTISRF
jgi:hypothetical protein